MCAAALSPDMFATDIAYWLVRRGVSIGNDSASGTMGQEFHGMSHVIGKMLYYYYSLTGIHNELSLFALYTAFTDGV
jgi:hypothetical protein